MLSAPEPPPRFALVLVAALSSPSGSLLLNQLVELCKVLACVPDGHCYFDPLLKFRHYLVLNAAIICKNPAIVFPFCAMHKPPRLPPAPHP